ncbi:hypothetical protein OPU71_10300 [Niveibacterium sp. 24ML]|uniref:hypothetical protein n=1 Tax=Niveibacterium sp. 24ML TaxID=2985512 RepID=UPI002271CFAB|nr:hypothetical protein [Niveibacterium sp. 24ML]MCX9156512.1 hypothetical protein [Niveibacterium sp. 24ML]
MNKEAILIANQVEEILEYDDRTPPRWHGHVGHASALNSGLVITRSYASPREGANEERLRVFVEGKTARLVGFDENNRHFDISRNIDAVELMQLFLREAIAGCRAVRDFVEALRKHLGEYGEPL